ncbi:MAG: transporter [Porphyromonadaceae bacterium CG2_30_38_12]|nr:MAG: transporter [Porphyromonadaceae bacterium CG2_30_38_12]
MRRTILILVAFLTALLASAQAPWTLQQCIDTALNNNRNIKQRELMRQTNQIAWQQARNNLLPNLSAGASQGWSFGRSQMADGTYRNINSTSSNFNVSAGINLFDGLKMKYDIEARSAELKISQANLLKIKQDIVLSVSSAFLQVLLNKELLQVAQTQNKLTEARIEQQKALVENGKLAEGELLELYAQQAKEALATTQATNALKLSLLDLAQIIERSDFENMDVQVPSNLMENELQVLGAEAVFESALKNRAEIKSAEYQLNSSQKNVLIAKSAYYPQLSFGANIGGGYYNAVSTPLNTNLGFNLSVPIFNKFQVKNQVRTAQLDVKSNMLNLENAKLELRKTVQQAYYNALAAKAKWEASTKSALSGAEAYRFATQKYEGGRANVYELYQAKNNLAQAQSEVAQSKYEYVFRLKILELLH